MPETLARYTATCPECQSTKEFDTERAHDLWLRHHAHDSEEGC